MSLHQLPFKLVEITIISAQDLPPVSKMLRTFAVAYIHPDNKLSTKVDHKGNTNPKWNYKVVFLVDDAFLKSENPAVTIEIYNVACLRDLPIGTTHLPINNLLPQKSQCSRLVALQMCRPTGNLQGILNLSVHLIDNSILDEISGSELSISTIRNNDAEMYDQIVEENKKCTREGSEKNSMIEISPKNWSTFSPISEKLVKPNPSEPDLQAETKSFVASSASIFSVMRPLPSEVAAYLKKGLYSIEGDEYGSSVFENWSLPGESEDCRMKSVTVSIEGRKDDQIPLTSNIKGKMKSKGFHRRGRSNGKGPFSCFGTKSKGFHRRGHSNGKGLFSCFGNFVGFQFSFICGSKRMKKNRNNRTKFSFYPF